MHYSFTIGLLVYKISTLYFYMNMTPRIHNQITTSITLIEPIYLFLPFSLFYNLLLKYGFLTIYCFYTLNWVDLIIYHKSATI